MSSFLFFSVCLCYYISSVLKTDGHYIYPLDDAYIHLAMAKNFALYEVWGMTKYQFSSSSSSPLFTYILSVLIKIFGNSDQISLYFNTVFSVGILYLLSEYYAGIFKEVKRTVLAVLFTVFLIVLPLNILSGMEHILQVFLFVVNVFCFYHYKENRLALLGFISVCCSWGWFVLKVCFILPFLLFCLLWSEDGKRPYPFCWLVLYL